MLEETTSQLVDVRTTQAALADTVEGRGADMDALVARCADLEERLREEVERKDYLALELHKAEGGWGVWNCCCEILCFQKYSHCCLFETQHSPFMTSPALVAGWVSFRSCTKNASLIQVLSLLTVMYYGVTK